MTKLFSASLDRQPSFDRIKTQDFNLSHVLRRLELNDGQKFPGKFLQNIVSVQKLTDNDIGNYLEGFARDINMKMGLTPDQIKDELYKIYDLRDLMSRPLLLRMVVVTILEVGIKFLKTEGGRGPASIYDFYTQMCAHRDYEKWPGNQILTEKQRIIVCREIALTMMRRNTLELGADDIVAAIEGAKLPIVRKSKPVDRAEIIERAHTDVRVCSFLSPSQGRSLQFAHKSYFEFFVAQAVIIAWQQEYDMMLKVAEWPLSKETIYFLGSYARDENL